MQLKIGNMSLTFAFLLALFFATLTLWMQAYWPVAMFEVVIFVVAGTALVLGKFAAPATYPPLAALTAVVFWGLLQLATGLSINTFVTERAIVQWMTWAALYYAGVCLLRDRSFAKSIRTAMVWFGLVVAGEAILQAYLSPGKVYGLFPSGYPGFVMGPILYHTHFAVLIEVLLPIAVYRAITEATRSYVMTGISAVFLTSLVVSASRGGLVIAIAEFLAVLFLLDRRRPLMPRRPLLLVGTTVLLIFIVGFEAASRRFFEEAFIFGRLQFARSTLHMIAAHPLFGWGLGSWPFVYPAFATFDPGPIVNQAHTDWLQWTADGGVPVGITLLGLAVWSVGPALRSIWGIGVLAVFIHATFDYPFSRPAVGAWPILMLAMAVANEEGKTIQG